MNHDHEHCYKCGTTADWSMHAPTLDADLNVVSVERACCERHLVKLYLSPYNEGLGLPDTLDLN